MSTWFFNKHYFAKNVDKLLKLKLYLMKNSNFVLKDINDATRLRVLGLQLIGKRSKACDEDLLNFINEFGGIIKFLEIPSYKISDIVAGINYCRHYLRPIKKDTSLEVHDISKKDINIVLNDLLNESVNDSDDRINHLRRFCRHKPLIYNAAIELFNLDVKNQNIFIILKDLKSHIKNIFNENSISDDPGTSTDVATEIDLPQAQAITESRTEETVTLSKTNLGKNKLRRGDVVWAKYSNWDELPGIITSNTSTHYYINFFDGSTKNYKISRRLCKAFISVSIEQALEKCKNRNIMIDYLREMQKRQDENDFIKNIDFSSLEKYS